MKKILFLILMMIFVTSCGVSNRVVTLGNVTVFSPNGEKIRTYKNVVLEKVPSQDTLTFVHFTEQNGTEHYINNSIVVVEGVEQIVEPERINTTSVVVYPYAYYYPYYNTYYYHYPKYTVAPPRRIEPRPQPKPNPHYNHSPRKR